ncbi:ribonuclease P protein component [Enterococcus canis]|jgi:ribonuclease P protein component, eubacterial|nr:ribonuclease P protein component [Enterococcus canis]
MKKSYRVKHEQEFQKVFKRGNSCANRKFVIYLLEKPEQKHFRVGLSVGKKIGNAVTRNRVKRRIRQGVYELKDSLRQDVDFLIIARPSVEELSMDELQQNLIHVLRLAKLL